jgi:hypothetical protein
MRSFVIDISPKWGSDLRAECLGEGSIAYGIGAVVEKETNGFRFPGEQNVYERDRLDVGSVGQEQFHQIQSAGRHRLCEGGVFWRLAGLVLRNQLDEAMESRLDRYLEQAFLLAALSRSRNV